MTIDPQDQIDWLSDQIAKAQIMIDGINGGDRYYRSHDGKAEPNDVTEQTLNTWTDIRDRNTAHLAKLLAKGD